MLEGRIAGDAMNIILAYVLLSIVLPALYLAVYNHYN